MINTFNAGNHILRKALQISMHEMAVLSEITALSWNSKTGGWCIKSRAKIADYIDLSVRAVQDIMKTLYYKGYIEYPDDLGVSDTRVRCTDLILSIRDSTDIGFIVKDASGKYILASTSFFDELRKVNPSFDEDAFKKHLGEGVKKLHPSHFSIQEGGENISQAGAYNVGGGAESAYINTPLNYQINNTMSLDRDNSIVSIAKSDTDACTLQREISVSHSKKEPEQQDQMLKLKTQRTRARGAATEPSETGQSFAKWFSTQTPMKGITPSILRKWAETCDKLIQVGYVKKDVSDMCLWALKDPFWSKNFLSATKLLSKNKDDVSYHEIFMLQVKQKRAEEDKLKPKYNERPYNPTGAHLKD